jgi:hypothetical protein
VSEGLGGLTPDEFEKLARSLYLDPVVYCREILNFNPTHQQEAVLSSIRAWVIENQGKPFHEQKVKRIAVRSGHGTGKSRMLAGIVHWWQTTRTDALTVATAPKASQLEDVLWREFTKLNNSASAPFNDQFEILKDEIRHKSAPKTQRALARTARKENPEALQGFHDPNMLVVCDEASGIPEEIFEVGEGALSTPGCLVILTGNPTRVEGTFYNAFGKDRDIWERYHFNREDLDPTKYPFLDPHYPDRMAQKYGRDSNVYRVRVIGDFPTADPDTLIPLWQVEAAVGREISPLPDDPYVIGVDVARFGDDESVMTERIGWNVVSQTAWRQQDTMQVAYRTNMAAKEHGKLMKKPCSRIFVDTIGVGGGVADRLRDLGNDVVDVNVSEQPACKEDFRRLRDELYWELREAFEQGRISISEEAAYPDGTRDSELVNQLASIKYKFKDNKLVVESKDDRKRRGLPSPDRAESLLMTFAQDMVGLRPQAQKRARQSLMPEWAPDF